MGICRMTASCCSPAPASSQNATRPRLLRLSRCVSVWWRVSSAPREWTSPSRRYTELADRYGAPTYARVEAPADREQKARLARLSPDQVRATELAGEPITAKLTAAPGNGAPLGGLKVTTANAWFAARPSGTEDIYKIYAESFNGPEHLAQVQDAARELVNTVIE